MATLPTSAASQERLNPAGFPPDGAWRARTLVAPEQNDVVIAAFSGPAPGPIDLGVAAPERPIAFAVLLGSLGDSRSEAAATLDHIDATFSVPVLAIPGGDDLYPIWVSAFDDRMGPTVDATGIQRVVTSEGDLVLVPGAPRGRYARDADACGFGVDDVSALVGDLAPCWAAPVALLVGRAGAAGGGGL